MISNINLLNNDDNDNDDGNNNNNNDTPIQKKDIFSTSFNLEYKKESFQNDYNNNSNIKSIRGNVRNILCNNCLKYGHYHNGCKLPIISYGIILFRLKKNDNKKIEDSTKNEQDKYKMEDNKSSRLMIQSNESKETPKYFEYLMIRRKNTFGYLDFIKGKHLKNNIFQMQIFVNEMTNDEKKKIILLASSLNNHEKTDNNNDNNNYLKKPFYSFNSPFSINKKTNIFSSLTSSKFYSQKKDFLIITDCKTINDTKLKCNENNDDNTYIDDSNKYISSNSKEDKNIYSVNKLKEKEYFFEEKEYEEKEEKEEKEKEKETNLIKKIIENSKTNWVEPEWEFPKGKRNNNEKDIEAAIREFKEETGYSSDYINIIENVNPFEEIFIGSNYKCYKTKYFLAYTDIDINIPDKYQKSEVSKVEWKTYDNCITSIRDTCLEKKQLITNVNNFLNEYSFVLI